MKAVKKVYEMVEKWDDELGGLKASMMVEKMETYLEMKLVEKMGLL